MDLEQLAEQIPEYAKDLRLNLGSVLRQTELSERQTWSVAVSCALACRHLRLLEVIETEATRHIDAAALSSAKTAAAVMGMNNVFYRFRHLSGNDKYASIPARLRMQAIRTHGGDPVDFELCCLAVSAINGCGVCIESHDKALREKGMAEESVSRQ